MAKDVYTIFEHETDSGGEGRLGIDDDGNLYWNERRVITERRLKLRWWVNLSVVVGGLSTLVLAVVAVLTYLDRGG